MNALFLSIYGIETSMMIIGLLLTTIFLFLLAQIWVVFIGRKLMGVVKAEFYVLIFSIFSPIVLILFLGLIAPKVELNPNVKPAVIIGKWRLNNQKLTINNDLSYSRLENNKRDKGTWSLDDWNLRLYSNGDPHRETYLRVIQYKDHYRLLRNSEGVNADMYFYNDTYQKEK